LIKWHSHFFRIFLRKPNCEIDFACTVFKHTKSALVLTNTKPLSEPYHRLT
jgi:hypothetical protein